MSISLPFLCEDPQHPENYLKFRWASEPFGICLHEPIWSMGELSEWPITGFCEVMLPEEIPGDRTIQEFPHGHLGLLQVEQFPNPETARAILVDVMIGVMGYRLADFEDLRLYVGKAMIHFHLDLIRSERSMSRAFRILRVYVEIPLESYLVSRNRAGEARL